MNGKRALVILCFAAVLLLAGCAVVDDSNSFQNQAPGEVAVTEAAEATAMPQNTAPEATATEEPAVLQPTQTPETTEPPEEAGGYNG